MRDDHSRLLSAAGVRPAAEGAPYLEFDAFADWGIRALVTTRAAGSFATAGAEPVGEVMGRWDVLQRFLFPRGHGRFATARQVHGADLVVHTPGWRGWLRADNADGHVALDPGTGLAVSVADCVPVYVAHRSGAVALLHAGWRGTVAGILAAAVRVLAGHGLAADELRVLLGPAICGRCYEVSPDVHLALTGQPVEVPTPVSLRGVLAGQAAALGMSDVRIVDRCTRCDGGEFFSHRAGDAGRQLAVLLAPG